jgi:hypothetical protein
MTNDNVYIYDHLTGEEIVREMTDKEQADRNAEIAANAAKKQTELIEAEAVATAKADAATKLTALGIDPKALGL